MSTNNFEDFVKSVKVELNETRVWMKEKFDQCLERLGLYDEGIPDEKYTGLMDKNGNPIQVGDTVRLTMKDGSYRCFKVCFKTVKRKVYCHPIFKEKTAEVYITGVVFCWNGYDLFPRCGENGDSDTEHMEVLKV